MKDELNPASGRERGNMAQEYKGDYTKEQMKGAVAVIETNRGAIKFEFLADAAPGHCENFINLANKGFYDGCLFHRVIEGFMIQGGCPQGAGTGGPGYHIKAEFNDVAHVDGTVSMARTQDPDSAGSQFFICLGRQAFLDGKYSAFGQVIEGLDVVHQIGEIKTDPRDRPLEDQVMNKVTIEGV